MNLGLNSYVIAKTVPLPFLKWKEHILNDKTKHLHKQFWIDHGVGKFKVWVIYRWLVPNSGHTSPLYQAHKIFWDHTSVSCFLFHGAKSLVVWSEPTLMINSPSGSHFTSSTLLKCPEITTSGVHSFCQKSHQRSKKFSIDWLAYSNKNKSIKVLIKKEKICHLKRANFIRTQSGQRDTNTDLLLQSKRNFCYWFSWHFWTKHSHKGVQSIPLTLWFSQGSNRF